jgi:hypothetical protein
MGLIYADGFEGYATAQDWVDNKELSLETTTGTLPTLTTGRKGGQTLTRNANSRQVALRYRNPNFIGPTAYIGFAVRIRDTGNVGKIVELLSETGVNALTINIENSAIAVSRDNSENVAVTPYLKQNVWYHIGIDFFLDNSTGTVDLYLDGGLVDSFAGDTIRTSASADIEGVTFVNTATRDFDIDDFYLGDNSGSGLTAQFGDAVIEPLSPDGAGLTTDFTPSAGANFENVDDTTYDEDTTYNSTTSAGASDTFTLASPSWATAGTIAAVQTVVRHRKATQGNRTIRSKLAFAGSPTLESFGAEAGVAADYYNVFDIFTEAPGGSSWTFSDLANLQMGYEVTV